MSLKQELDSDPLGIGYASFKPDSPGSVVAKLSYLNYSAVKPLLLSERGILERYPDGPVAADAVLTKLEQFALSAHPLASVVKRALKFLAQAEGLDLGSGATQGMLTMLAQGGVITDSESGKLKGLAMQPATRAEVLGLGLVTEADVVAAWSIE